MSGAQETPRQKMIGMMYLVLTAMLALNVSIEVLKSFIIVNNAMEETNANFQKKVETSYSTFEKQYLLNPTKTQAAWDKAQIVREKSTDFYNYIQNIKYEVIAKTEGITIEQAKELKANQIGAQDNYDTPTLYFIGESEDGSKGKAAEIRKRMAEYKEDMVSLLKIPTSVDFSAMNTDGPYYNASGQEQSWEMQHFYHTIIVADLTILNKIQADILNIEFNMVRRLFAAVSENDFKFDNISAKAIAKSNYVLQGGTYEAELFVAAYDSRSRISAVINGETYQGQEGRIEIKRPATTPGRHILDGSVNVPSSFGTKTYPIHLEYTVDVPTATVSADAMNVMYVGVDNPVSAAAGGVNDKDTKVTISDGTIEKVNGKYIARVKTPGKNVEVKVYSTEGGKERFMGSKTFRVKRVPDPIARVNGQESSVKFIDKNTLANAGGLIVMMKDFDFELTPQIASFALQISRSQELSPLMKAQNNKFTSSMIDNIKRCKRGDKVFISEIKAKMPDGTRELGDIILTIR